MTTQTETLEALHLWLAERTPELRVKCEHRAAYWEGPDFTGVAVCPNCHEEWRGPERPETGWVPNVTTDGLLEALQARGLGYRAGRTPTGTVDVVEILYHQWSDGVPNLGMHQAIARAEASGFHLALCSALEATL